MQSISLNPGEVLVFAIIQNPTTGVTRFAHDGALQPRQVLGMAVANLEGFREAVYAAPAEPRRIQPVNGRIA